MTQGPVSAKQVARGAAGHGNDRFGRVAEKVVRVFGLPWFLATQTVIIAGWVALNAISSTPHFDPYPFIFLNLVFSALAAYAAPLILLAETRQAERDKARTEADVRHREEMARYQTQLMREDTEQTEQIARLLKENREQTIYITKLLEQVRQLLAKQGH